MAGEKCPRCGKASHSAGQTCVDCGGRGHHEPDCRQLRWPDGTLRGSNPGAVPSLTRDELIEIRKEGWRPDPESPLARELGTIFAGSAERMMAHYAKEGRTCPSCSR